MRILTLNLRQGGGRRVSELAAHVRRVDPDVAVLTEFRASPPSQRLLADLSSDFPYVHASAPTGTNVNGVAVISRRELCPEWVTGAIPGHEHRWAQVKLLASGIRVVGLYVPGVGTNADTRAFKARFWASMLAAAPSLAANRTVVIGDLNTGRHRIDEMGSSFWCADEFAVLGTVLVDAWRDRHGDDEREFSWYSHVGNGFRLDHAFISPDLKPLVDACWYDHAPRTAGATDHSMLGLDVAID